MPINSISIVGAGQMGRGIAQVFAAAGKNVTLYDISSEITDSARCSVERSVEKLIVKGKLSAEEAEALISRISFSADPGYSGTADSDLVLEAAVENLDIKKDIFRRLDAAAGPGCILATNTSSIPLQDLRTTLAAPQRLVGLHFFNPVSRLQLVEVVSHDGVDPQVLSAARAFVGAIDRLPLPVKSSPGFLVNRALTPYMLEAMVMLDEKVDRTTIDAAAEKFGMPMGPIELADQVGLDICLAVGDMLRTKMGDSLPAAPDWLREKVAKGELGRKTGKGFYTWTDGKAQKTPSTAQPTSDMIDRLILPMSNVCVACLREGIVDNADVVDGAMIFGTGYAPFRGGPLNYARSRGVADVVAALQGLANRFGDRFKPDAGWDDFKASTVDNGPRS